MADYFLRLATQVEQKVGEAVFAHEVAAEVGDREGAVATRAVFLGREVTRADVIVWLVSGWVAHIKKGVH